MEVRIVITGNNKNTDTYMELTSVIKCKESELCGKLGKQLYSIELCGFDISTSELHKELMDCIDGNVVKLEKDKYVTLRQLRFNGGTLDVKVKY